MLKEGRREVGWKINRGGESCRSVKKTDCHRPICRGLKLQLELYDILQNAVKLPKRDGDYDLVD